MKRFALALVAAGLTSGLVGCVEKATKEDCTASCKKLAALKPAPKSEDPMAAVEANFAKQLADVQTIVADEIKKIDDEYAPKLGKAKPKDKDKLTKELTDKKDAKVKELQPKIDEVANAKAAALKEAQDKKVAADKVAKEKADKDLAACADSCFNGGTAKAKTDCQTQAANVDAFNKCQ